MARSPKMPTTAHSRVPVPAAGHRGCTTSMTHLTFRRPTAACRLELIGRACVPGRADQNRTLTRVLDGNNPRFPRTNYSALHHQTDVQARNTTDGSGSTGNTPQKHPPPAETTVRQPDPERPGVAPPTDTRASHFPAPRRREARLKN